VFARPVVRVVFLESRAALLAFPCSAVELFAQDVRGPGLPVGLADDVHWVRDTAYREDAGTGYTGAGPQVLATCKNIAISLLYLAGVTQITRTLQAIGRDRTRLLGYLPL